MTIAEERVLKPLNPIPSDVNEWPDFALREVKIFYQGKGRYADLLEACEKTPLCVLGELMPLHDEQEHLALVDSPAYTRMKIDNVKNYSFGQDEQGKPVVWAAGKAGWYEITPSDRYLHHYNDTIEAVDLFYFMVDQYHKLPQKRKRLGFQVDPFLTAYQKHTDFRIDDDDEAMETIHKHHAFLMKQMIEEREGIDWSQTHLWKHLAETYADEVEVLQTAALASLPQAADTSSPEALIPEHSLSLLQSTAGSATSHTASPASQSAQSESESDSEAEAKSVSASAVESDSDAVSVDDAGSPSQLESESEPESELIETSEGQVEDEPSVAPAIEIESESESESEGEQIDWTRPIFDLLNVLRKQSTFDIKNAGIEEVAAEVAKMPMFTGNHKKAIAIMEMYAEPLLRLMNEAKLRKKFNWSTRAIYAELEATLADEVAEDVKTPAAKRGKDKHRMKSVLRPSGASKSRKRTRGDDADDEDEDIANVQVASGSSPMARRHLPNHAKSTRELSIDSVGSRDDSPSRQLNGYHDHHALPVLPPAPEAQEMIDLVMQESKRVGRQNQTHNLKAFLGGLEPW